MTTELSPLNKLWIFDLDGTIVKHNGYLHNGDELLDGVKPFCDRLSAYDQVLIVTARKSIYQEETIAFLKKEGIRFNRILFDMPTGERMLINDKKPSGLLTAYAYNTERDQFLTEEFVINKDK